MKSQGFLANKSVEITETIDARKKRFEGTDAVAFVRRAEEVWIAKGKSIHKLALKNDLLTDEELLKLVTGPTGNLRAPTIRRGRKLFIGFHPEEYEVFLK